LAGPSRKSFIAKVAATIGAEPAPSERLGGSIASCLALADRGAAILRVHDVAEVRQALVLQRAIRGAHA
jgi:dihydropteroate synthase